MTFGHEPVRAVDVVDHGSELRHRRVERHAGQVRGHEFDRQRPALHELAQRGHRRPDRHVVPGQFGTAGEESLGVFDRKAVQANRTLSGDHERLSGGREHRDPWTLRQQTVREGRGRVEHVLAVVQHEHARPVAQLACDRVDRVDTARHIDTEDRSDAARDQRPVCEVGQGHEPSPLRMPVEEREHFADEATLAHATGAKHGDQSVFGTGIPDPRHIVRSADE